MNLSAALRARRGEDESGFTLIELMVVVLIIAILIAIAIPTFLGAKSRAQDKSAQSSLRNAITNAKGIYTDTETYVNSTPAALLLAEPSLTFQAGASTGPKNVSVDNSQADSIVMAAWSKSQVCFAIADVVTGPGTLFLNLGKTTSANCTAAAASATALPTSAAGLPANATVGGGWAASW